MPRTRTRSPRRLTLDALRLLKRNIETMVRTWDHVPSKVWYDDGDGRGMQYHKPDERRTEIPASEYRENQVEQWERTAKFMIAIMEQAHSIHAFAESQIIKLLEREMRP